MNLPTLPSWVQFLAKAGLLASALVLAILHHLTPEVAMVLSSALVALGVTNGAQLVAQAGAVAPALTPPSKPAAPPPPPPPPSAVAATVAAMIGVPALALIGACAGSPVTPLDQTQMTSETIEDTQCVTANRGDAGAIRQCRAGVERAWDAYWQARFQDGGGVTP